MRVDVLTIFPEMFHVPMSTSMMGIAQEKGVLDFHAHDLRDWTHDRHRTTDDTPYGGGAGLVMTPPPIFEALNDLCAEDLPPATVIFFTPLGEPFTQEIAQELAGEERLVLVCGRYEGFDERVYSLADRLISLGDYVVSGGELPAMMLTDAVVRLLPGVLGHDQSAIDESFSEHLLEYPQYTRPAEYRGMEVPEVLRSGDHGKIAAWRREQSVIRTAKSRPDLLSRAILTKGELELVHRLQSHDDSEKNGCNDDE